MVPLDQNATTLNPVWGRTVKLIKYTSVPRAKLFQCDHSARQLWPRWWPGCHFKKKQRYLRSKISKSLRKKWFLSLSAKSILHKQDGDGMRTWMGWGFLVFFQRGVLKTLCLFFLKASIMAKTCTKFCSVQVLHHLHPPAMFHILLSAPNNSSTSLNNST